MNVVADKVNVVVDQVVTVEEGAVVVVEDREAVLNHSTVELYSLRPLKKNSVPSF